MRAAQAAALAWGETGDVSDLPYTRDGRSELRERVDAKVDLHGALPHNVTQDLFNLALKVEEGDLVIVAEGDEGRAIGRVTGPYEYAADSPLAAPPAGRVARPRRAGTARTRKACRGLSAGTTSRATSSPSRSV